MNEDFKIGASILSADFANLGREAFLAQDASVDYIHIDIMDGRFVEGITWGPEIITALKAYINIPQDVHLMIEQPENFVNRYIEQNPHSISIHPESTNYSRKIIKKIKENNIKAGAALKLETPVSVLENLLDCVDYVLLLTSEEGFGGNEISHLAEKKIKQLQNMFLENKVEVPIQLDGGIKADNIRSYSDLGVDYFVLGSAIFNEKDIYKNIENLREV